jgi:hypothetical protein
LNAGFQIAVDAAHAGSFGDVALARFAAHQDVHVIAIGDGAGRYGYRRRGT